MPPAHAPIYSPMRMHAVTAAVPSLVHAAWPCGCGYFGGEARKPVRRRCWHGRMNLACHAHSHESRGPSSFTNHNASRGHRRTAAEGRRFVFVGGGKGGPTY